MTARTVVCGAGGKRCRCGNSRPQSDLIRPFSESQGNGPGLEVRELTLHTADATVEQMIPESFLVKSGFLRTPQQ